MNTAQISYASRRRSGEASDAAAGAVAIRVDLSAIKAAERVKQCRAALMTAAADDYERRAEILAALATAQSLSEPDSVPETLADARRAAERAGTNIAAVYVMIARYATDLSPEALPRRIELADSVMSLLERPDCADLRDDLLPLAYFMYLGTLMESGDIQAVDAALSPEVSLADPMAPLLDTRYATWFRCVEATMDGRLFAAERLADEGYALALARGDVDAEHVRMGQLAVIRWMQGRISEMESVFVQARRVDPAEPIWAASVAWIWSHQGRTAAARGVIESLPDLDDVPRGRNWLAAVAILAEVAAEIGSDALVDRLRRALLPFANRVVTAGLGVVCWGTAARPLALLARRQGRHDEARVRYREAIALCSKIGAQAWLAQAQAEYGALELEHGNVAAARSLAKESASAAHHLGLRVVELTAHRLLALIAATPANSIDLPSSPARVSQARTAVASAPTLSLAPSRSEPAPRVTVLGDFTVTPPGMGPVTWRSRKARTLLQVLIARRGQPIPREAAMHLLWPGIAPDRLRNRFSVALTAVRRALDPGRSHPPDRYIAADADVLRIRMDRLSVDVEDLLALAEAALSAGPESTEHEHVLRATVAAYGGEAFADEPYAEWAGPLRQQAHVAFLAAARTLAEAAAAAGDPLTAADLNRRVLQTDPYDQQAHEGLIGALTALGATAHITAAREERDRRMTELGLPIPPSDPAEGVPHPDSHRET